MSTFKHIKTETKNKTNELYNQGKDKLSNVYEEEKKLVTDTYNKAKDKTESMAQQFTDGVSNLYGEGKKKVGNIEESMEEYSDEFIKSVKDRPLKSLLIAGGIGFLLSFLFKK